MAWNGPVHAAVEFIGRQYSADFKSICLFLLSKPTPGKTIEAFTTMLAPRLAMEADNALLYVPRVLHGVTDGPGHVLTMAASIKDG